MWLQQGKCCSKEKNQFHKVNDIVNQKPFLWQHGAHNGYCVQVGTLLHQKPDQERNLQKSDKK